MSNGQRERSSPEDRRTAPKRGREEIVENPRKNQFFLGFRVLGGLSALKTWAIWGSGSRTTTTKTPAFRYSETLSMISSQRSFSEQTSTTSSPGQTGTRVRHPGFIRFSIHHGVAETLRREGVGHSVEAFGGADHEYPLRIEGRVQAMAQTAAGRVVEINQKIPAQDQVKSSQVGQRLDEVESAEFDHAAERGIDDPGFVFLAKESSPAESAVRPRSSSAEEYRPSRAVASALLEISDARIGKSSSGQASGRPCRQAVGHGHRHAIGFLAGRHGRAPDARLWNEEAVSFALRSISRLASSGRIERRSSSKGWPSRLNEVSLVVMASII